MYAKLLLKMFRKESDSSGMCLRASCQLIRPYHQLKLPWKTKTWGISYVILLHEKFLQFDWLRAVVFEIPSSINK